MSARKKIVIRTSGMSQYFKWYGPSDGDLFKEDKGKVGNAKSLEDAIALAKANTVGEIREVQVKDD